MAGIFVERVPSSRFQGGSVGDTDDDRLELDRHRHRILVSDAVFKSRWSDLNSSDLIALDPEMLRSFSSGRFDYPDDIVAEMSEEHPPMKQQDGRLVEKKRLLESSSSQAGNQQASSAAASTRGRSSNVVSGVRSMSEIVRLTRLARPAARTEEERRWVPIARRTARWFARREEEADTGGGHVHVQASSSSRV